MVVWRDTVRWLTNHESDESPPCCQTDSSSLGSIDQSSLILKWPESFMPRLVLYCAKLGRLLAFDLTEDLTDSYFSDRTWWNGIVIMWQFCFFAKVTGNIAFNVMNCIHGNSEHMKRSDTCIQSDNITDTSQLRTKASLTKETLTKYNIKTVPITKVTSSDRGKGRQWKISCLFWVPTVIAKAQPGLLSLGVWYYDAVT